MEIKRYTREDAGAWDAAVVGSRQGTFMFKRAYMDYHADRFEDFSLMAVEKGNVRGVMAANVVGDELYSHGGLTYGGWLTPVKGFDASTMLRLWQCMNEFLRREGIRRVHYKSMPWIYARIPAEEDAYALFRNGAVAESCQVSSVIDLRNRLGFDSNARRNMRKGLQRGLAVVESADYGRFWPILEGVLEERYRKRPVHSLEEIRLLAGRFPENIRLHMAVSADGCALAGAVMYLAGRVAHVQYIASSREGKECGALAVLFGDLVERYGGFDFFDFGISCEDMGKHLNEGLLRQKSGFGGRCVNYVSYRFETDVNLL